MLEDDDGLKMMVSGGDDDQVEMMLGLNVYVWERNTLNKIIIFNTYLILLKIFFLLFNSFKNYFFDLNFKIPFATSAFPLENGRKWHVCQKWPFQCIGVKVVTKLVFLPKSDSHQGNLL